jgi:Zn-dependent peptidase ImmA (M78 family)
VTPQKKANNKFDISDYRKRELSDLAEFIADKYFKDTLVCPHQLAEKYKISCSFEDYGAAFDGMLEYKNGSFHIFLNSHGFEHKYLPRIRFTMAHEIGHYIIDEHRGALINGLAPAHPSFTNFSTENTVELEADYFASSLLLPSNRVISDIKNRLFSINIIKELSTRYQTSITATLLKFASIGNHPIMIVCTINKRIKWFKYSYDFPFKFIETQPGFHVPKNTSAGEYFYDGVKNINSTELVFAGDWFRVYNKMDANREFCEYCFYSDKNNFVMSVIWEKNQ